MTRQSAAPAPEPLPIWMAALIASACQTLGQNGARTVEWQCVAEQALYTNVGEEIEVLHPFGVSLRPGQTVVVTWKTGDTAYTVDFADPACLAA